MGAVLYPGLLNLLLPGRLPTGIVLYGAVIGATIFILAENYLQALMGALSKSAAGLPVLPQLFDPDRWLLWLGVLFVLSVYFFPAGIVGKLARK